MAAAEGQPPTSWAEARRAWQALPRARRRHLEGGGAAPADTAEAVALVARGRYLRSWPGAVEWVLVGAAGALIATAMLAALTDELPLPGPSFAVVWIVGWGASGIPLRRWRGRRMLTRGGTYLQQPPAAGPPGEFGSGTPDG